MVNSPNLHIWHCFHNQPCSVLIGGNGFFPCLSGSAESSWGSLVRRIVVWGLPLQKNSKQEKEPIARVLRVTSTCWLSSFAVIREPSGSVFPGASMWKWSDWVAVWVGISEPGNDLALREAVNYMASFQKRGNDDLEVGAFDKHFP